MTFRALTVVKFAIIGYSVGGVRALQLAMKSIDVDALVTLDPTFGVTPLSGWLPQWPLLLAGWLSRPWLYMYQD